MFLLWPHVCELEYVMPRISMSSLYKKKGERNNIMCVYTTKKETSPFLMHINSCSNLNSIDLSFLFEWVKQEIEE